MTLPSAITAISATSFRNRGTVSRSRRCAISRFGEAFPPCGLPLNVSNDLADGPHLVIHYAIELLSSNTQLAPGLAQTTLGAGESYGTRSQWQLSYLGANAQSHFPALTCCRFEVHRHLALPRPRVQCFVAPHN
jgi:hypothetical protein